MTIVVADDSPFIRRLVLRILRRLGSDSVGVEGTAALARSCRGNRPQAVISDVSMKDGDGIEACLELRRRYPGLPIVMMTGAPDNVRRALAAGLREVLQKPFLLVEMEAALKRSMAG